MAKASRALKTIGPMRLAFLMCVSVSYVRSLAEQGRIVGAYRHKLTGEWCFPRPVLLKRIY